MPDSHETLEHALRLHKEARRRIGELERAVTALNLDNEFLCSVHCSMAITQGTAWSVELPANQEVVRQFFEAALLKERDTEARYRRKLDAARAALQADQERPEAAG